MPEAPRRPRQSGVTLLEMLVVLVIVAMVAGVLFDGLGRVVATGARTRALVQAFPATFMDALLFERSTADLIADHPDGGHNPAGDGRGFSGLSVTSLQAPRGVPRAIAWRIENRADGRHALVYESGATRLELITWRGPAGGFAYLDGAGKWVASWPAAGPAAGPATGPGAEPALPRAIRVALRRGSEPITLVAAITQMGERVRNLRDLGDIFKYGG